MKIARQKVKYTLSPESIDIISEQVQGFLTQTGSERKNTVRLRLSIESILIRLQEHFGKDAEVTYSAGTRFGRPYISISCSGEQFDPTENGDDFDEINSRLFAGLGLYPEYSYSKNTNIVSFRLKKGKSNPVKRLLTTLLLAGFFGFLGYLVPAAVRTACYDFILTPVYNVFVGILNTVAGPMVFLSVAWGIYGIGDAVTLGKIGKKMFIRFVVYTILFTAFAMAVYFPLSQLHLSEAVIDSSGIGKIMELILNVFPRNIVSPFLEGNTMQIILLAAAVGCITLILGSGTELIAAGLEQANHIVQYMIEMISGIVPVFIFIIILRLLWSGSLDVFGSVWKPFLIFVLILAAAALVVVFYVCAKEKIKFTKLIRKMFPGFFIAVTTASSSAAFGTVMSSCEHDLGVSPKLTNFGLPLSMVLFKPSTSIGFIVVGLSFAKMYNVDVSIAWIIITMIVVTTISIALPPIPGGALACYSILFTQLGIPQEALGITMILEIFIDFISTGIDTLLRQCELVLVSGSTDLLDRSVLHSEKR